MRVLLFLDVLRTKREIPETWCNSIAIRSKVCYNETGKAVKCMIMIYLLFAMSIFMIRILAGYDSRYQNGKYLSVKNTVLSKILLDSMSIYSKTKRLKKDKNKMSICGIPFYVAAAFVLLINLVFLFITDIPIEPWGIETSKFIVYANTLNDKISAISILLLLMSIIAYIAVTIIHSTKETKPKWIKVFAWIVALIMILTAVLSSIYFLIELIASFS